MNACPNRTGAGWSTIYFEINQRMINLYKTEEELDLDFSKPLGEQDPIIKLNDLAKKKRKHADDLHDYFRSTKRYKYSVKYEDHPAGTILNEPSLGEIVGSVPEPFILLVDLNLKYPYCSLAEDSSTSVLQFNLVDNFKLNDVDLLSEVETKCFSSRRTEVVYQGNSSSSSNVDRILYQPPLPADQVKPSTEFEYEGDICLEMYADRHFIFPLPSLHKICVVLMMVLPDMDSHFLIVPPYSVLGRVSSDNASCVALEALLMQVSPLEVIYGVRIRQKSQENRQKRARERKSTKEAKDAKPKPEKVKKSTSDNYGSTKVNSLEDKSQNIPFKSLNFPKITQMVPKPKWAIPGSKSPKP
ncbi:hypothetical protein Tco_0057854 [Tanacetum coccineum]